MKHLLATFALLLSIGIAPLISQNADEIKAIDAMIASSKISYDGENYDLAIDQAAKAYKLAKPFGDQLRMAKALQREAMGLMAKTKKVKASRKAAQTKLEESLALLTDAQYRSWRINGLKLLEKLAKLNKDSEAATRYRLQISELENLIAAERSEKRIKAQSNKLAAKTEALESKAAELEDKTISLAKTTESLSDRVSSLAVERKALTRRIKSLNEEQLEAELLIEMEQRRVDSLSFKSLLDSMTLSEQNLRLSEQATQLQLQENAIALQASKRNTYLALLALLGLGAAALGFRYRGMKQHNEELKIKNEIIEAEKAKSEELLLNILPSMVAQELKMNGEAKARRYNSATVLFTDFVNFSGISKELSAEKIVDLLDRYFKIFDEIITKYNLEKIKTIGDAYMAVGGLPNADVGSPVNVVNAALEIQKLLERHKKEATKRGEVFFEARIGIHTGPLVAGVVGSKKFAFDIWGDTVNVAARLETGSLPGKVNISAATYALIKDQFECESRGEVPVKNIGSVEMYFVKKAV